jgi:A/G-specific adenine glycosylase
MIVKQHGGKFPKTFDELKRLKGIGDYTAAAIASFAFGERVAVVDGNVFRVLSRVFGIPDDIASTDGKKKFAALANALLPATDSATHNQAMMEFGALMCTPRKPACDRCPLASGCYARKHQMQADFPVKRKPGKSKRRYFYYVVVRRAASMLMTRRAGSDIWKGLWDFPLWESQRRLTQNDLEERLQQAFGKNVVMTISREYKHVLSHQVLLARFLEVDITNGKGWPARSRFPSAIPCGPGKVQQLPKPVLVARYLQDRGLEG